MIKEICICSAVKIDGKIFRGHRHGDAMRVMREELTFDLSRKELTKLLTTKTMEQGFVTSKNRYVGRTEGRILQDKAGIKSADKDGYRGNTLFSEDLY